MINRSISLQGLDEESIVKQCEVAINDIEKINDWFYTATKAQENLDYATALSSLENVIGVSPLHSKAFDLKVSCGMELKY